MVSDSPDFCAKTFMDMPSFSRRFRRATMTDDWMGSRVVDLDTPETVNKQIVDNAFYYSKWMECSLDA